MDKLATGSHEILTASALFACKILSNKNPSLYIHEDLKYDFSPKNYQKWTFGFYKILDHIWVVDGRS
jgi:hypothetical protein